MQVVEVIFYKTFKERLQLMRKYIGKAYVEIYPNYIYVERVVENKHDR